MYFYIITDKIFAVSGPDHPVWVYSVITTGWMYIS